MADDWGDVSNSGVELSFYPTEAFQSSNTALNSIYQRKKEIRLKKHYVTKRTLISMTKNPWHNTPSAYRLPSLTASIKVSGCAVPA